MKSKDVTAKLLDKIVSADNYKLFLAGSFLTVLGISGGFLSYVFQILIGRMLGPADYANFNFIISISIILTSPFVAVSLVTARHISILVGTGYTRGLAFFYNHSIIKITRFSLFLLINFVIAFLIFPINSKISSVEFVTLFLLVICAVYGHLAQGFFQGVQKFFYLGSYGVVQVLIKIIITVLLLVFGFGLIGVYIGAVTSALIVLLYSNILIKRHLSNLIQDDYVTENANFSSNSSYLKEIFPLFIASIAFALFTQFDIILVKLIFGSDEAGAYVAASILAKTILYLPGGFVLALYPIVSERYAVGKETNLLVYITLVLTFVPCFIASLLFMIFPELIISTFYGDEYTKAAGILKFFGYSLIPLALVLVLEHFLIARRKILFAYIFIIIAPLQVLTAYFYANQLVDFVYIFGVSGLLTLIIGIVTMVYTKDKSKTPMKNQIE